MTKNRSWAKSAFKLLKSKMEKLMVDKKNFANISDLDSCYRDILKREPDKIGHEEWSKVISRGISKIDLIKCFLTSEEYLARFTEDGANKPKAFNTKSNFDQPSRWFHSIKINDEFITKGDKPYSTLCAESEVVFKYDITGKSVIDIGAWDGFFSFEAERRGAKSVLATDHFSWSGEGWGTDAGFVYARNALKSSVKSRDIDVFDLNPNELGTFNIALFLGVLYHLPDPYNGLKHAAAMTDDLLIMETETAFNDEDLPLMRFYRNGELNNDKTNFWAPNLKCIEGLLFDFGFTRIEYTMHPDYINHKIEKNSRQRHIVHAWRK